LIAAMIQPFDATAFAAKLWSITAPLDLEADTTRQFDEDTTAVAPEREQAHPRLDPMPQIGLNPLAFSAPGIHPGRLKSVWQDLISPAGDRAAFSSPRPRAPATLRA